MNNSEGPQASPFPPQLGKAGSITSQQPVTVELPLKRLETRLHTACNKTEAIEERLRRLCGEFPLATLGEAASKPAEPNGQLEYLLMSAEHLNTQLNRISSMLDATGIE